MAECSERGERFNYKWLYSPENKKIIKKSKKIAKSACNPLSHVILYIQRMKHTGNGNRPAMNPGASLVAG